MLPERRALAEAMGATTTLDPATTDVAATIQELTRGNGVAMAVETTGNFKAVMGTIEESIGVGGKVAVVGMDARPVEMNLIRQQLKAGSIYGTVGHSGSWDFPNVIALMASGKIQMEKAVTRKFPLSEVVSAIDETKGRSNGKILVKPQLF
jgi:threonine dehydrogenase-like Zn-dependent dehydrogenase